ncbi:MAG: DUF222 domain-containing protein [Tetrasphaera sp.]|nr:DUF222 domain-containing protein [Tetrasphaera sp.]
MARIDTDIDTLAAAVAGGRPVSAGDLAEADRLIHRLQAQKLALIAQADRQRIAPAQGCASTAHWVATTTRSGGAAASAQVSLATALAVDLPVTRSAMEEGSVSTRHAQIIASTMSALPTNLTPSERALVEDSLVRDATHLDPARLRTAATRALAAARRPEAEVAEHQETVLADQERRADERARITLHDSGDGTTTGHFTVPTGAAHILRKVLHSMTAPRRDHHNAQVNTPPADLDREATDTGGPSRTHPLRNDDWDRLGWDEKRGRAFTDLLEHLPTDALTGKVAATVVVTDDPAAGARRQPRGNPRRGVRRAEPPPVGATRSDTGHHHSTGHARRLACQAGILPAVLGGRSLPLDLGREDRFFRDTQRTALATIYDECAATGCDRPYAWCELHHEDPWSHGGRSDLHLAVPLCGFHHRRVHDPTFHTTIHTNQHGTKHVTLRRRT